MPSIVEGHLRFDFDDDWFAEKYDAWSFYRNQFNAVCGGCKAVDIVALAPDRHLWLIEVKDYRTNRRSKPTELPDEVAQKVRDTLAGLFAAACSANDAQEQSLAKRSRRAVCIRVVLHLEQPKRVSKLHPRVADPANLLMKLKQLVKPIDAHPRIHDRRDQAPWSVR